MPKKKTLQAVPDQPTPEFIEDQEGQAHERELEDIQPAPVPKKLGRPTKYREEFCEALVAHMRVGLSFESFAGVIGVNQDTIHEWAKKHPAFSEAKKIAWGGNLLFWEKVGIQGTLGRIEGFNCGSWIFNMKNRHRWNDGRDTEAENPLDSVQELFRQANAELDKVG